MIEGKRKLTIFHALIPVVSVAVVMFTCVISRGIPPHVAMLVGCLAAGIIGLYGRYTWDEILEGMVESIKESLEAVMILMIIGLLMGVWISSGVVPTMIYFGLKLLSPQFFLVSTMLICSLVSMAIGSWGTAGTVGIAFMGIAQAMGVPSAITAAAVVSGAYMGDKLSPLSDSCNLATAVTNVNVFDYLPRMLRLSLPAYAAVLVVYGVIGWNFGSHAGAASMGEITTITDYLGQHFSASILALVPLVILILCIVKKIPAIPSIVIGIIAGGIYGVATQGLSVIELFSAGYYGYVGNSGIEVIDQLLSAGGMESMLYTISMIVTAMMFGGIMEKTGQMNLLIKTVVEKIKGFTSLTITTLITAVSVNAIIPDQYLAIVLPGRMYAKEYDKHNIERVELTMALGVGGSLTSPLIPWNTCGIFMTSVLGVSTYEYAPFCFMNLFMPLVLIAYSVVKQKKTEKVDNLKNVNISY